jgi:RNA polymerase sigma-70 factor (ECF subfamily)
VGLYHIREKSVYQNPRRLRRPEERVGNVTNADLPPPAGANDSHLLAHRLRARDEAAFRQLFHQLYPAMLRVARSFVRTIDEAEEVIQETWLAVLHGIDRFEGRSSLKTWIFRILVNRARTRARREARTVAFFALPAGSDDFAATTVGPEQAAIDNELRLVLERAVASLPRVQRRVISLRDIEGWSADEVCEALDLSPANQRVVLHRARMRVREMLAPYLQPAVSE